MSVDVDEVRAAYDERQRHWRTHNPHVRERLSEEILKEGRRQLDGLWEDVGVQTTGGHALGSVGNFKCVFDMAIELARQNRRRDLERWFQFYPEGPE